jgi:hypothetical protein
LVNSLAPLPEVHTGHAWHQGQERIERPGDRVRLSPAEIQADMVANIHGFSWVESYCFCDVIEFLLPISTLPLNFS